MTVMRFRLERSLLPEPLRSEVPVRKSVVAVRAAVLTAMLAFGSWASPQSAPHQAGTSTGDSAPNVVLRRLFPPIYPSMAVIAGLAGDVSLKVSVHPDGGIESVEVISGHHLLVQIALESAKQSQFECRSCSGLTWKYLTYSFHLSPRVPPDPCCCSDVPHASQPFPEPQLSEPEGRITVESQLICICPDTCPQTRAQLPLTFRSMKCLYLWKCSTRRVAIQ